MESSTSKTECLKNDPKELELGLHPDAIKRYSRQAIVPGIGIEGQSLLCRTKLAVVGLGGLGSPVLQYLAMAGVGEIGIVDHDSVELHNLQRQSLHRECTVGQLKTRSAAELIRQMNSTVTIREHSTRICKENVREELSRYDVILDCTDGLATRYVLCDFCRDDGKLLICAAVLGWEGQVCVMPPEGRCFRCMFHGMKRSAQGCDQRGVVGPMCGVLGSLQATEAIKAIIMPCRTSRLTCINGLANTYRTFCIKGACECRGWGEMPAAAIRQESPEVTWEEVHNGEYQIIDIRTSEHFKMMRAKGSVNMESPLERIDELLENGKPVAVVCYKGNSAAGIALQLREAGIEAFRVVGGIEAFR